ncbi:pre-mRNA-processing factor, putative [Entamoeba invadens IP1]|uniref:Pre-mRNA-processing factor, putative n=1 Tax=Entamoeba invadens IP1 TaxID=370355 RepID=A0A0A1U1A2_ENTIV|nr:pre-mRNA-processing factor, putative [Entamoeba invadens IP1]ELP84683.1 pre-mRNA-processing factor, putative [Entamoeba invadens IP1]|eukprot:XP_004184029.1 pre-mRNA-processing factor, putative [Entamoeba invadens IP1]
MKSSATEITDDDFEKVFKKSFRQQQKIKKTKLPDSSSPLSQDEINKLLAEEHEKREKQKESTKKMIEEYAKETSPTSGTFKTIQHDLFNFQEEKKDKIDKKIECEIPKKCQHAIATPCKTLTTISVHKSGDLVACGGSDGVAYIYSISSRKLVASLLGHHSTIPRLSFSDNTVVTVSLDGTLKVWDLNAQKISCGFSVLPDLTAEKLAYKNMAICDDKIFAGCVNERIYQYDQRVPTHVDEYVVSSIPLDVASCGKGIMCSCEDRVVRYFDYGSGSVTKSVQDPSVETISCLTDYKGKYVLGQSMNNSIVSFRGDPFRMMAGRVFRGHYCGAWSCRPSFSSDGQFVVSGDANGKIFMWDWKKGKVLKCYTKAHNGTVADVAWNPVIGNQCVSCGWDGKINIWN